MLKYWFRGFVKYLANCKRSILLSSIKKVLTELECHRNHPFCRITPKVDWRIEVSFESERMVIRCDNSVYQMAVTKFCLLYMVFRPKFPFFLVLKSTLPLWSTDAGLTWIYMILIFVLLNLKSFIVSSISPLFKRPFLWHFNKTKHNSSLIRVCCVGFL